MNSTKKSYLQILKSTTLLGGVHTLNLLVGVLRTKAAALLIGVDGLGLVAMLNSIIDLLRPIFNLGLNTSAVKEVSQSAHSQSANQLAYTIQTTFILLFILGGMGAAILFLFADLFCLKTFNSLDYLIEVRCLSILLITNAIFNGYLILFQGLRELKRLAFCNALSGLISLLLMIPFYYFYGIKGVAPYLIANGIATTITAIIVGRKLKPFAGKIVPIKELWNNGNGMVRMGLLLTINTLFGAVIQFYLRQHLLTIGGIGVVGLYAASITILEGYGGILFTAMSGDYYPRLASLHRDKGSMNELIDQQIEVGVLLSSFIVIGLISFSPIIIQVLLSSQFYSIMPMLLYGSIGLILKAVFTPMDYVLIVKQQYKWVMTLEILSIVYLYFGVTIGYRYGGFTGIGIGYLLTSILNWVQIKLLLFIKYKFQNSIKIRKLIWIELLIVTALFCLVFWLDHGWIIYIAGSALLCGQLLFTLRTLMKQSGISRKKIFGRKNS